MSDSIFLVGEDGLLAEMTGAAYRAEADLQKLLADNIQLLPGAQIDQDRPRRWTCPVACWRARPRVAGSRLMPPGCRWPMAAR